MTGAGFEYVVPDDVRILFVDDDPIMREFAQVHLATDTGGVSVAGDGVEALEAIAAGRFDIVLLDLEMPRMDGFEVLRRLRADPGAARLPVIVVTGREDVLAIDQAFQAGATSFLVKPINWRLLSYQVRYVIRSQSPAEAAPSTGENHRLREIAHAGAQLLSLTITSPSPEVRRAASDFGKRISDILAE